MRKRDRLCNTTDLTESPLPSPACNSTRRPPVRPAGLSSHLSDALLRDAAEAILTKLEAEMEGGKPAEARVYVQVRRNRLGSRGVELVVSRRRQEQ